MSRSWALAATILFAYFASGAAPIGLASHLAVYNVTLAHTSGDVVAARGRMAIAFRDTCDGWSTTQRLIADMTDSDGDTRRTDFIVRSWESKDGRTMRFDISDTRDGKSFGRRRGQAKLVPIGLGRVELAEGKPSGFPLPEGTEFPTSQTLAVLGAAQSGRPYYKHVVFQGGDRSDVNFSTAIIGAPVKDAAVAADRAADKMHLLRGVTAWPVLISFFPMTTRAETPDYEVATRLFANGVNGSMSLIYRGYTLRATLSRLVPLRPSC